MIRIDISNYTSFSSHRSGWGYCMSKLMPFHSKSGILFDDFLEKTFGWDIKYHYFGENHKIPYKKDWIGVIHNPPTSPAWFDPCNTPKAIIDKEVFQNSLKKCKALVTLSEYAASHVKGLVDVPVVSVKHPTEIPSKKWNIDNYLRQDRKELVQLGYWLRVLSSIHRIKCDYRYRKIWLPGHISYAQDLLANKEVKYNNPKTYEDVVIWAGVQVDKISNEDYDELFSRCVCLLNLYDASANNAVIECIARNTPILVNRLPAVEEYLGKDYPLYIDNLDHASELLYDIDKIYEAHIYLKNMNKDWISGQYFATNLITKLDKVI